MAQRRHCWGKDNCTAGLQFYKTGLDQGRKYVFCMEWSSWIQTCKTGGQPYRDTSPIGECSLNGLKVFAFFTWIFCLPTEKPIVTLPFSSDCFNEMTSLWSMPTSELNCALRTKSSVLKSSTRLRSPLDSWKWSPMWITFAYPWSPLGKLDEGSYQPKL